MRRVSPCSRVLAVAVLAASCITAGAARAGGTNRDDPASYRVMAGPYSRKEAREGIGRKAARESLRGLTISVEYLEPGARAAFVTSKAASLRDPFAVRPGAPEVFSTFRVAFDNASSVDVQFQAGNVVLITDRRTQDFPVDLTDLYRLAAGAGVADPEGAVDRVAPVVFDSSTTIRNGDRVERLLVFGPFPPKWKELQLHFSYLQIGAETHTVSFSFHKQPRKE